MDHAAHNNTAPRHLLQCTNGGYGRHVKPGTAADTPLATENTTIANSLESEMSVICVETVEPPAQDVQSPDIVNPEPVSKIEATLNVTAEAAKPVEFVVVPACERGHLKEWHNDFQEQQQELHSARQEPVNDDEGYGSMASSFVSISFLKNTAFPFSHVNLDDTSITERRKAINELVPPVTRESLKELELKSIQNNLALRIDLCFDHELFFQRISGLKGEEKVLKSRLYFSLLAIELKTYAHSRKAMCNKCQRAPSGQQAAIKLPCRLESCLEALFHLVDMLVPENEKEDVRQRFDARWIARGIRTAQFDVPAFFQWLADLLMSHCAPIRDEMAKGMSQKISTGITSGKVEMVIEGLKELFDLLESMKLDIANHQVRSFKFLLITDTVPFLKDCFRKMIASKQMNVEKSKQWYERQVNRRFESDHGGLSKLLCGVLDLCSGHEPLPRSFTYDQERVSALRNDILDLWQLHVCLQTFCTTFHRKLGRYPGAEELSRFRANCLEYIHSEHGINEGIEEHLAEIAVEISKIVSENLDELEGLTSSMARLRIDSDEVYTDLTIRLQDTRANTLGQLMPKIAEKSRKHAVRFLRLDTLQVSNDQRKWTTQRASKGYPQAPEIEDIARRMAHVVVIHWQVWSDMVYLKDAL